MAAILFFSATLPVSAGETVCHQAAATLRIGSPSPSSLLRNLNAVVEAKEEGDDAAALLRAWNAGPDLLRAVEDMTSGGQIVSRIVWFERGALGAVEVVAGTAECQSLLFFRVLDGKAVKVAAPKGLTTDGACWTDSVWMGKIGGTPYAVEENNGAGSRARSIVASAWTGTAWGPACSLTETHSITLVVENLFCRPGMDCAALQEVALERARAMEAEYERVTPAIGPIGPPPGRNETGPAGLPQEIPTFDATTTNPYRTFTNQQVFQASYMGQPIVGAVGAGHWGWRDYDGWLVGFWRPVNNAYEPLSGLQISRQVGVVLSVDIRNP